MLGRIVLVSLLLGTGLSFAFKDSDLDGVEDSVDRCPNTPLLELVDRFGCPLRKEKLYLRLGGGFLRDGREERVYGLTSLAYSLEGFYLSFTLRYYTYSRLHGRGMGDSTLFLGYSRYVGRVYLLPGVRVKIPTGDTCWTVSTSSSMVHIPFGGKKGSGIPSRSREESEPN